MREAESRRPNYRADLDGLRGVAVVLVILFHVGGGVPGGYIGVDVFFTLSGYLIAGLVAADLTQGRFSLVDFWVRRTRRLAPPALVVFALSLLVGYFVLLPRDYSSMANVLQSQLTVTSNVYLLKHLNYFDGPAEMQPLLHTWSLSVEEQFYIVFPLLLLLTWHRSPKWSLTLLSVLGVASFVTNLRLSTTQTQAAFFLLPSRAWELILGGVIALSPSLTKVPGQWLGRAKVAAFAAIVLAAVAFNHSTLFPGVAVLVPVIATGVLVIPTAGNSCVTTRWLSHRLLVATGKASYSLYLWHWPVLVLLRHFRGPELTVGLVSFAVVLTIVLATASYALIEQPVRQKRVFATSSRFMIATAFCWTLLMGLTQFLRVTKGYPQRLPARIVAQFDESRVPTKYGNGSLQLAEQGQWPSLGVSGSSDDQIDFLLWGDSHAMAAAEAFDDLGREYGLRGRIAARTTTIPLEGVYRARRSDHAVVWNQHILRYIREQSIKQVILAAKWVSYIDGRGDGRFDTLVRDDASSEVSSSEAARVVVRGLERTVAELQSHGVKVWILKQVPKQDHDCCHDYLAAEMFGRSIQTTGVSLVTYRDYSKRMDGLLASLRCSGVRVLDPATSCFDDSGHSVTGRDSTSYYADQDHLSPRGAKALLSPLLQPAFLEIAAARGMLMRERIAGRAE